MERGIKRKQATLLFVIAMLVTFCLGVGLSYAYFSDSKSASNTLSFGKLKVTVNGTATGNVFIYGNASDSNGLLAKGDTITFNGDVGLEEGSVNAYVRLKFDNFKYYTAGTTTEITEMNEGYKNLLSQSILSAVATQNSEWAYKESGGYQYLYYGKAMKAGDANKYTFNQTIEITENFIPTAFEGVKVDFDLVVEAIQTTGAVDESGNSVSIADNVTATADTAKKISTITMWDAVFPSQIEKDSVGKLNFTVNSSDTAKTVTVSGVKNKNDLGEIAIPKYVKQVTNDSATSYEWTSETSGENVYKVISIGKSAFQNCTSLTSITIPEGVTSIGESVFANCGSLTSIEIPSSLTSIVDYAFDSCTNLTSIKIPESVTSIGARAFSDCSSLTSITIPDGVTSIGGAAFDGCTSLTSIEIPSSVTSIGIGAFRGLRNLESIVVEEGNKVYNSINNCNAIIETITNQLIAGCKNTIIPSSVTSIGREAFGGCRGLTSIEIPNSVTSIGYGAFMNCSSLTSITIPSSVTSIASYAFYGCTSLTSIEIPSSVTSIGVSAFGDCRGLISIEIPSSVKIIDYNVFYGCSGLTSITIPSSVTSIGRSAFDGCRGLISIEIPSSVTSIDSYAFDGCTKLTTINYNGTQAQWNGISKTNARIPTGVKVVCSDGTITIS